MSLSVIGATSGIATACAQVFGAQEHRLLLTARSPEKLLSDDPTAEKIELDVEDLDSVQRAAEAVIAHMDEDPYVLVAVGSIVASDAARHEPDAALRLIDINFRNLVAFLTPVADALEARGRGCLIIVGSVAGDRGKQSNYVYGAAKAGLATFAQGLRNRLAPSGAHVLTVKPGFIDTPMLREALGDEFDQAPKPLVGSPEQAARTIYRAAVRRKDVVYVTGIWRWVMLVIRLIPERVFKKMKL